MAETPGFDWLAAAHGAAAGLAVDAGDPRSADTRKRSGPLQGRRRPLQRTRRKATRRLGLVRNGPLIVASLQLVAVGARHLTAEQ